MTLDFLSTDAAIEAYEALRERCYRAAQANDGALMGDAAWLRFAMSDHEMRLSAGPAGISIHGTTYTTQTMDHEWFDFFIPFEELEKH